MARSLNGSTDFIDCTNGSLIGPAAISFSGWIRSSGWTNAYNTVFGRFETGSNYHFLFITSAGKLATYYQNGGSSAFYDGTGANTLSTNTWYQIGFTYVTVTGGVGYVNGGVDGTAGNLGPLIANTGNTFIGKDNNTPGRFLPATGLADCAIWNVALTANEMLSLGRGARPSTIRRASLQGYWPLDGIASPEPDFSGNKYNGTLTGTAAATGPPITLLTPRRPAFLVAPSAAIYLRPDADSIDGGWTNELGGTTLFASIDESAFDDADYIQSSVNPSSDVAKIRLSNPSTAIGSPVKLRYRYKKDSAPDADLTVRLLQGVTQIAEWTHTGISTSFVTTEQTLTAPELASITDFDDLFIELEANS